MLTALPTLLSPSNHLTFGLVTVPGIKPFPRGNCISPLVLHPTFFRTLRLNLYLQCSTRRPRSASSWSRALLASCPCPLMTSVVFLRTPSIEPLLLLPTYTTTVISTGGPSPDAAPVRPGLLPRNTPLWSTSPPVLRLTGALSCAPPKCDHHRHHSVPFPGLALAGALRSPIARGSTLL